MFYLPMCTYCFWHCCIFVHEIYKKEQCYRALPKTAYLTMQRKEDENLEKNIFYGEIFIGWR